MCEKKGDPVSAVNNLLSFHTTVSSPTLFSPSFCFLLSGVLSSPYSLSPSITSFSHLFQLLLQFLSILTSLICPTCLLPPLFIHNTLSPPISLFPPFKSGGKFIRSKNKHFSVFLHVASPKAALRYGWPCLFASSGGLHTQLQHTPQKRTHFPKDTQKQSSLLFASFVIAVIPPLSQSGLRPFLWVHSNENEAQGPSSNKVPSPITQLLALNLSLLHYLLYLLLLYTHRATPVAIDHRKSTILYFTASLPSSTLSKLKIALFARDSVYTIRHHQQTFMSG